RSSPQELLSLNLNCRDPRVPQMLWRFICRNYPEVLEGEDLKRWKSFAAGRILFPPGDTQMNLLMQAVPDFERIGDYATNIDELAMQLVNSKVILSEKARMELSVVFEAVEEIVEITVEAFRNDDNELAEKVEPLEEVIDDMVVTLRDNHTERLRQGTCTVAAGLVFLDVLTQLERAADQCSSIALLMLARDNEEIRQNHHVYLRNLHSKGNAFYCAELERRREQYMSRICSQ
ncbi:MAG: hypothetical protein EOM17_14925, partial [Synergistales bacterium]|nr:hypothetical protein [Synergistales bacterium]